MKKLLTTALITLIAICLLAGCTSQEATLPEGNATPVTLTPFDMEEAEIRELYLKLYAEKQKAENFISDVEEKIYEENNLHIRNREDGLITSYNESYNESREYNYPIVLPGTDEIVIAYIYEYGQLAIFNVSQDSHDYFSNIHVPKDTDYIDTCANYSIVYSENSVQLWKFGKLLSESTLPAGSIYTGFSDWEGYIFRNGGDVYSVQIEENEGNPELICEAIAHNVKEIIVTDYKLNSDAWSQPLFLMEDGSIKAYCVWNGDNDAPRDDVSHLASPQFEGGYK